MSKVCTFFGHWETPGSIRPALRGILTELIEIHGVDTFYIGDQGNFDYMAQNELKELSNVYPHINYSIVLAYMPGKREEYSTVDYTHTIYPDGLESTPPRFAIDKRNRIMINLSDYVITYVQHSIGGAAKYKEIAEKKCKNVINLYSERN